MTCKSINKKLKFFLLREYILKLKKKSTMLIPEDVYSIYRARMEICEIDVTPGLSYLTPEFSKKLIEMMKQANYTVEEELEPTNVLTKFRNIREELISQR